MWIYLQFKQTSSQYIPGTCKTVMCNRLLSCNEIIERWLDYQLPYVEVACYGDRLLWICIIGHSKCHLTRLECLVVDNCGCGHHCSFIFSSRSSVSITIGSMQAGQTIRNIVVFWGAFTPGWLTQWQCSIHDLSLFYFVLVWLVNLVIYILLYL